MSNEYLDDDIGVIDPDIKDKDDVKEPPMYKVVFWNDDYTPMDFVVEVLETTFGHSTIQAAEIMLDVHQKGKGIAGVYTRDIAETKTAFTEIKARDAGHPLKVTFEPES